MCVRVCVSVCVFIYVCSGLIFLTGLQHGVIVSSAPYGLGLNETLLSQYLKELNYSTHIIGKVMTGQTHLAD